MNTSFQHSDTINKQVYYRFGLHQNQNESENLLVPDRYGLTPFASYRALKWTNGYEVVALEVLAISYINVELAKVWSKVIDLIIRTTFISDNKLFIGNNVHIND